MAVAFGFHRRLQTGPALRISPIPFAGLTVSAVLHGVLVVAAVLAINSLKESQPRVYVVNLVPAIPAIGRPEGQGTTPAPSTPVPPTPRPEPPAPPAPRPELPARSAAPAPPRDLPPRDLPPRPTAREAVGLPDRTLPPRSAAPATPRPDEKELPSVASRATATPPSTRTPPSTAPAREAAAPPPVPAGLPGGSPHGKGKLSIDVDFPYAWYVKIIRDKIAERWDPYALPGQQPRVSFEVVRSGQAPLARIRVIQSSGNRAYDQVAVRAIAEASPFPPLPDDFKDQQVTVNIQFRFEPERG